MFPHNDPHEPAHTDSFLPPDGHLLGASGMPEITEFGNFRENFIFANSVNTHICDVKNRDNGVIYLNQ